MKSSSPLYNQAYINTGHGQVVILLHGLFGNLGIWKSVIQELKASFHVVVPRLPLFELPAEHTNIKYLTKVLHDFIEFHQFQDVILVGHAIGGQVALLYAHHYPDNVAKLVLTSSAGLIEKSPILDTHDQDTSAYTYVYDKIVEAFYVRDAISGELVDDIYTTAKSVTKRSILWSMANSSRRYNVGAVLPGIHHPVLLLWGLQDKVTPPEAALLFHDLLPNSELRFIDQCGHFAMVEKAPAFTAHLLSFFQPVPCADARA
jgi:pimeloyl-ACP methyl ester carboxylesterase